MTARDPTASKGQETRGTGCPETRSSCFRGDFLSEASCIEVVGAPETPGGKYSVGLRIDEPVSYRMAFTDADAIQLADALRSAGASAGEREWTVRANVLYGQAIADAATPEETYSPELRIRSPPDGSACLFDASVSASGRWGRIQLSFDRADVISIAERIDAARNE